MKSNKIFAKGTFVIVLIALLTTNPYVFFLFLPIPPFLVMMVFTFCALCLWSILYKPRLEPLPKNFTTIFTIQVAVWMFFVFLHRDTSYFTRIIYMAVAYLALLCLYNVKSGIQRFFALYNNWIKWMAIGGTVAFFLILLTGMPPLFNFTEFDDRTGYCFGLTTTNAYFFRIIRYAGYFDEPGQMAFWGVWALIFNYLFFQNAKFEKVLSICLIFTFSMAYYIQMFFYIIFFKIRDIKNLLILFMVLGVIGCGIYSTKDTDLDLYVLTFKRFETSDTGEIKGDNRSELTDIAKDVFLQNPIFGVGARQAADNMKYMNANPFSLLAFDGIVGTINTYLPLIFLICTNLKRKDLIKAILIIFLGYMQRPFGISFIFPFTLYSLFLLSYLKYYAKRRQYAENYHSDRLLQCCRID